MATREHIKRVELADDLRTRWWVRALLATEQDKLGCILRAAMNKQQGDADHEQTLVSFGPKAIILDDTAPENGGIQTDGSGIVWTNVLVPGGLVARTSPVCTLAQLVGAMQRLIDQLEFVSWEADALAAMVRAWIHSDQRKNAGNRPEDRLPVDSIDKDS